MQDASGGPTPIALLVDDPTPLIHLYRHHMRDIHKSAEPAAGGVDLVETIPNAFLDRFCDVVERWGIRGKFSIVPAPMMRGDVVRGIAGHDPALTRAWMETVTRRLAPFFDFGPEMINHSWAVDLATGATLPETEHDWSQHQTRSTLTPYIARALALLKEAGVDATGVTSPWMFGEDVEPEYVAAIVAAQREVYGRTFSWYFLHIKEDPMTKPWVASTGDATLVSVPAHGDDYLWDTIWKIGTASPAQVGGLADRYLTANGKQGLIARALEAGGWPVIVCHWQTLFSNGHETGLAVLDEIGRRVDRICSDSIRWSTCLEMAHRTAGV